MNSTLSMVLYMAFFIGLMYFMVIRPQNKKSKQLAELRNNIKSGDDIVTIGGIVGKVLNIKNDEMTIEVGASKTKLTIKKWAVSTVEKSKSDKVDAEEVEYEEK